MTMDEARAAFPELFGAGYIQPVADVWSGGDAAPVRSAPVFTLQNVQSWRGLVIALAVILFA